jgi:hypothetical protein
MLWRSLDVWDEVDNGGSGMQAELSRKIGTVGVGMNVLFSGLIVRIQISKLLAESAAKLPLGRQVHTTGYNTVKAVQQKGISRRHLMPSTPYSMLRD